MVLDVTVRPSFFLYWHTALFSRDLYWPCESFNGPGLRWLSRLHEPKEGLLILQGPGSEIRVSTSHLFNFQNNKKGKHSVVYWVVCVSKRKRKRKREERKGKSLVVLLCESVHLCILWNSSSLVLSHYHIYNQYWPTSCHRETHFRNLSMKTDWVNFLMALQLYKNMTTVSSSTKIHFCREKINGQNTRGESSEFLWWGGYVCSIKPLIPIDVFK